MKPQVDMMLARAHTYKSSASSKGCGTFIRFSSYKADVEMLSMGFRLRLEQDFFPAKDVNALETLTI